jgi:iron complex transport system ATP-binding protein
MIELDGVRVEIGAAEVVRGVSFTVESGEWVSLIGPNGAGKTTVLRALSGLIGYRGSVRLDGTEARDLGRRELSRRTALVPQLPERPAELTVAEYVLLGRTPHLGYLAAEGPADREAAARAIERLELERFVQRPLGSLSGGELQRAVLARALAQDAPILLLDEPTSALDLGGQQQALELVDSLRGDRLTILSAMHDLTLAGQYADRLVLLDRGVLAVEGTPREVLSPANLAAFYGASVHVVHEDGDTYVLPRRAH